MLSKNQIKYVRSLHQKKFRQKYNIFAVEGEKMAFEILRERPAQIEQIYALSNWAEEQRNILKDHLNKTIIVSDKDLSRISSLKTPNKVFITVRQFDPPVLSDDLKGQYALFLDQIQDPGNLGTIIRIADWFGIEYVFCSEGCADFYNPKVIQATMGALFRKKMIRISLQTLKAQYPELAILGLLMEGQNIYQMKQRGEGIIVVGNEGSGISKENQQYLTQRLSIPAGPNSHAESLNAAVATGIACAILMQPD